jgi:hypothetical protein
VILFPVITLPLLVAIAIEGYWYVSLGIGLGFVPVVYLIYLEYKAYPKDSSPRRGLRRGR